MVLFPVFGFCFSYHDWVRSELASHAMNELASATEVTKVIAFVSHRVGKGENIGDGVGIHTVNTIEGIDKHRIAMSLRDRHTDETESGNNKVIRIKHDFYRVKLS
tara:strand:+ start:178 stop:492 length:315 start_codon:yes stop_codon:yes gene_type:complete